MQGKQQTRATADLCFVREGLTYVAQPGLEHKVLPFSLPECYFPNSLTYVLYAGRRLEQQ